MASNISSDLIWECTRGYNSYLVKRPGVGHIHFSRDPLNLTSLHSKKAEGFVNDQAFGLQPGKDGGVTISMKKAGRQNKPANSLEVSTFSSSTSTRKTYRSVVRSTAKKGYRPDLRAAAISRASAIRHSQRPVKDDPPTKLRGKAARKEAEGLS